MKAIIIEENRFDEFLQLLKAHQHDARNNRPPYDGISQTIWQQALDQARREYNYVFVRWAQSHGASCVR